MPFREDPVSDDLLEALLRAALAEGETLDERNLKHFAEALRARADQILRERVQPIAERAAQVEDLKRERQELIAEKQRSAEAHDRLLAHHRATLLRLAENLESLPRALPWSYRRVRAQIAEILESLRGDEA